MKCRLRRQLDESRDRNGRGAAALSVDRPPSPADTRDTCSRSAPLSPEICQDMRAPPPRNARTPSFESEEASDSFSPNNLSGGSISLGPFNRHTFDRCWVRKLILGRCLAVLA